MANILILGGGFGGVIAAETLAKEVGKEHQITLVSRSPKFIFYPELGVRAGRHFVRPARGDARSARSICPGRGSSYQTRVAPGNSRAR
jgi:hypothetical protein